ncbi:uncharacterized protein [Prorops nasuta]|uniref:uncharacterized protein n=1 Tax=Prorops nasuta TaxID=863751 RepID=UPI0034CD4B30
MVPCAQGRVIVESTRSAAPHFATCSTYRKHMVSSDVTTRLVELPATFIQDYQQQQQQQVFGKGAVPKSTATGNPQSPATRPEKLGVTPWYLEEYNESVDGAAAPDTGLCRLYSYAAEHQTNRAELTSNSRNSSIESTEVLQQQQTSLPRKAYMDLSDAIALLDETCPNQEPSPSLTPRTPRTPLTLTPHPSRNKRARSKSSDNSSNYSNERLSDRSLESGKEKEKKSRPFLKKIGISMTEDRPLFAKLAPRIIGRPIERITPACRIVERTFLEKLGSSRTLVDKFTFDTTNSIPANKHTITKQATMDQRFEALSVNRQRRIESDDDNDAEDDDDDDDDDDEMIHDNGRFNNNVDDSNRSPRVVKLVEPEGTERKDRRVGLPRQRVDFGTAERRRSGKNFLSKMYSFETEDLDEPCSRVTVTLIDEEDARRRDSLRRASLENVLEPRPMKGMKQKEASSRLDNVPLAELVKCRVTTSEEIICSSDTIFSKSIESVKDDCSSPKISSVNGGGGGSIPNSPTKRRSSASRVSPERVAVHWRSNAEARATAVPLMFSPTKTRRQRSEDVLDKNRANGQLGGTYDRAKENLQLEIRGISSDNLLEKSNFYPDTIVQQQTAMKNSSQEELKVSRGEYSRKTFKQLQDKFESRDSTETYAAFKRRTRGALSTLERQQAIIKLNIEPGVPYTEKLKLESPGKPSAAEGRSVTVRSVLRKQQGIDHPSDQDSDCNSSLRKPKRRIVEQQEPSQETMDLLTELRKVKSLLRTPSWEKDDRLDQQEKPRCLARRVLLTDKEFSLSMDRESGARLPASDVSDEKEEESRGSGRAMLEKSAKEDSGGKTTPAAGPALFEKKCLSLEYADEERGPPQRSEARKTSLASAGHLKTDAGEAAALVSRSKSYTSDVLDAPSEELSPMKAPATDPFIPREPAPKTTTSLHCCCCPEQVGAVAGNTANDERQNGSPVKKVQCNVQLQGRTSEVYEIVSPISSPFRVKKRLGKISIEDTVKPESFTLGSKVDCRSVAAVQKRTKCFPL